MKKRVYEIPLYLVMLIPFVVYGKLVETGLERFPWFSDNTVALDVFLYYKQRAVFVAACMIILSGIVMVVRKEPEYRSLRHGFCMFLPFAIYVILDILSSLASPYKKFAWNGMMEQFESSWVIMGYFLICVYSYMVCSGRIFLMLGIFAGIEGAIGTLQYFGIDIYQMEFVQRLLMPQRLQKIVFEITAGKGRSYGSLSNPNYVGVICCLTIPVLTALAVCARKCRGKILFGVSGVLLLCSLVGSRSKSGILVLAGCMVLLSLLLGKQFTGKMNLSGMKISVFIACIALAAGWYAYRLGTFSGRENISDTKISEIETNKDSVKIVYDGRMLFFAVDYEAALLKEAVSVVDGDGKPYLVAQEDGRLCFEDMALSQITAALVKYGDYTAMELWDGSFYWYFTNQTEDKAWHYLTCYGKTDRLVSGEVPVYRKLEGRERIASGRGYIWSRTIPLIRKYILTGSGQDTFAVVFPNDDYLGMARWGYKDLIVTKPHSMYLQIAVQSGMLSLIALLVFWGCYFVKAAAMRPDCPQSVLAKAVAIGILGYLLMGITNDSNIGTAPIFWMLLGIGIRLCADVKMS